MIEKKRFPCFDDVAVDLATLDTRSAVREKHSRNCFDFLVNAQRDFADVSVFVYWGVYVCSTGDQA